MSFPTGASHFTSGLSAVPLRLVTWQSSLKGLTGKSILRSSVVRGIMVFQKRMEEGKMPFARVNLNDIPGPFSGAIQQIRDPSQ
jgi:hypothetical protein